MYWGCRPKKAAYAISVRDRVWQQNSNYLAAKSQLVALWCRCIYNKVAPSEFLDDGHVSHLVFPIVTHFESNID